MTSATAPPIHSAHRDMYQFSSSRSVPIPTLQALGDGMLDAALLARYEEVARPEEYRWGEWSAAQLDKITTSLAALEVEPHRIGGRVDIGTITVACALWYLDLRFASFGWRERFPQVSAWYEEFGRRPSMAAHWALG